MIQTDGKPTITSGTRRDFAKQAAERRDQLAREIGPTLRHAAKREAARKGER